VLYICCQTRYPFLFDIAGRQIGLRAAGTVKAQSVQAYRLRLDKFVQLVAAAQGTFAQRMIRMYVPEWTANGSSKYYLGISMT
jgi:hypothetical protein